MNIRKLKETIVNDLTDVFGMKPEEVSVMGDEIMVTYNFESETLNDQDVEKAKEIAEKHNCDFTFSAVAIIRGEQDEEMWVIYPCLLVEFSYLPRWDDE